MKRKRRTIEQTFNYALAMSCGCKTCQRQLFDTAYKAGIKRGRELQKRASKT